MEWKEMSKTLLRIDPTLPHPPILMGPLYSDSSAPLLTDSTDSGK